MFFSLSMVKSSQRNLVQSLALSYPGMFCFVLFCFVLFCFVLLVPLPLLSFPPWRIHTWPRKKTQQQQQQQQENQFPAHKDDSIRCVLTGSDIHFALLNVQGQVSPDSADFNPARIAREFWELYAQEKAHWTLDRDVLALES